MLETMTDKTRVEVLVEKARQGDRGAFTDLVTAYKERLKATITKQLRGGAGSIDGDDVVQETFVRALESLPRFKWQGDESFYLWLCGISRNVVLKRAQRTGRERTLKIPEELPGRGPSPSQALRRNERFDRLDRALSMLPADYREVLRLSRLERLKVKEIACRMDRSEYAVKHLIARAVRRLRETFGDTESLHLPDRHFAAEAGDDDE